ncbi:MAG: hypothetical protein AseanaTS_12900 [Candidatus Pelagadaptatus aseana]|uniref:hypothetical protein n=1 Tax=Candidatus Pelagadaptatus aseana TaxID=3120508 RepID=UPI0039B21224
MPSFLGNSLVENGLISADQLDKALSLQQQTNPLLGELAIEKGWLDAQQVEDINIVQRIVNQRFGDIAQEEMLLTADQVEQLVQIQQQRRQRLGDILIREGFIERKALASSLKKLARQAEQNQTWQQLSSLQTCALRSIESLFNRVFKSQCKHTVMVDPDQCLQQYERVMTLSIVKDEEPEELFMQLSIASDLSTAMELTASFLGMPVKECSEELARDSIGELLNMAAGYIISDPDNSQLNLKPVPARKVHNKQEVLPKQANRLTAVTFESNWGTSATLIALP